jgi:Zn finger protein HypA/HybF involved in hydrogenase expression
MTKKKRSSFPAKLSKAIKKKLGEEADVEIRCSFCAKPDSEVEDIIAGPAAYICNECVSKCAQVMRERGLDI